MADNLAMAANMPRERGFASPSRVWLLAGPAAFALYYLTSAPGVIWQDGGELQVRVALDEFRGTFHLARVHVLTVLSGSLVKRLFSIDPARAATLVSVVAGAVTVANIAALLAALRLRRIAVVAATITLAVSHTFWQFSAAAETNTLVVALLTAELLALHRYALTGRPVFLYCVAFFNGLGASNHGLAMLTLGAYAIVAVTRIRHWRTARLRQALIAITCWLLGFMPMLFLMIQDLRAGLPGGDVLRSLFVSSYGGHVFNVGISMRDLLRIAAFFALSFPTPLILLVPFGFRPLRNHCPTWFFRALLIVLGVQFLFAVRYDVVDQYAFFIPTYVLLTPLLAAAIHRVVDRPGNEGTTARGDEVPRGNDLETQRPASRQSAIRNLKSAILVPLALLPVAVYVVLPSLARRLPPSLVPIPTRPVPYRDPYAWFLQPWRHNAAGPARFAREALDALPPEALVLVDPTLRAPLVYTQIVEDRRRDVQINDGAWQAWLDPYVIDKSIPADLDPLVAAGRVYLGSDERRYTPNYGWTLQRYDLIPTGHLYRLALRPASPPPESPTH